VRAAVYRGAGETLAVEEVPDPTPAAGQLVLRVKGCGICGSDLHISEVEGALGHGTVMGHEFAGEVVEVGADARGDDGPWRVGDRVCALPGIGCGRCAACLTGDLMGCSELHPTGFGDVGGAYAEYVRVGARESLLLPDNLATADGALVEPLAVGLHAVEAAALAPGEDVLVLGAGPVGLSIALWARQLGAREVVVSDYVEARREMALRMGATAIVDPGAEEVGEACGRIAGHAPRTIFESVGRPGVIQQCVGMAPRGATILTAGMCMQPDTLLPVIAGVKEVTLRFVAYYRRADFELTIDMLRAERIDPQPMVTQRIGLDALPEAFEALRRPADQCKVIVEP